ncbi:MAG: hypothetical protein WCC91_01970 [Bradyrhizobium sp.]
MIAAWVAKGRWAGRAFLPISQPAKVSALSLLIDLRILAQHRVEQRAVNLDLSIVVDETFLAEIVHEKADPGSASAAAYDSAGNPDSPAVRWRQYALK